MATQSPFVYCQRFTSGESSLECATEIRSQAGRQNGRSRCKYDYLGRMFMSVTRQPAVHLGNDYAENSHSIKNQPNRKLKQSFNVTEKLIWDEKEISGISVINWQQLMWQTKGNLAHWQGSSVCDCKNQRLLRFSIVYGRNQFKGSSRTKFVRTSICWPLVGKTICGSSTGSGKTYRVGMSICSSETRIILIGIRGWHQNDCKEARIWLPCGRSGWKTLFLTNQLRFLITYTWDALKVNANRAKK